MKKAQILIITLVVILVLGCATFATLYFATDVLKSEKELFYKYASQMNITDALNSSELDKYQERIKSEKCKNEGSVSITLNSGEELNIDETFNYTSQIDVANKLAESKVTIDKEGEEQLTIDYLRNEDIYGIKLEGILNQYIAIENNNLKEFVQKLGIQDVSNIPDKIELSEYNSNEIINEEELKQIVNKYMDIIIEQIPEENYSKVDDGYSLTIDSETLQKVLLKVLNTLKEDEQVFNLINSLASMEDSSQELSFEEYKETLEDAIEKVSEEIEENYNIINIVVYKQGKIYVKIDTDHEEGKQYIEGSLEKNESKIILEINFVNKTTKNTEDNFIFSKNLDATENDSCEAELIIKEDDEEVGNIAISTTRNGKLDSNNIQNSMIASIVIPELNLEASLEYSNNKIFDSSIEIEKFNKNDYALINELTQQQIGNLITNLGNLISEERDLNPIEVIGAAGVGIISTIAMDSQQTATIGGIIGEVGLNIYAVTSSNLFRAARNTTQNAREQEEALAEGNIFYNGQYVTEQDIINGNV